jgi:hypothetical protein
VPSAAFERSNPRVRVRRPTVPEQTPITRRLARALREVMSITKVVSVFDIFESEPEAVAAFSRPLLDAEGQLLSYERARYETHS